LSGSITRWALLVRLLALGTGGFCVLAAAAPAGTDPVVLGAAQAGSATISIKLRPATVGLGQPIRISGVLRGPAGPLAGATLLLERDRYPYRDYDTVGKTRSRADGSYLFQAGSDRNAHFRVVVEPQAAGTTSRWAAVTVEPLVRQQVTKLTGARARVVLLIRHPADVDWDGLSARWFVAALGSPDHQLLAHDVSEHEGEEVTRLEAVLDTPGGRLTYHACIDLPAGRRALGLARCPQGDYRGFGRTDPALSGSLSLAPSGPSREAVESASAYLRGRLGQTAFAVLGHGGRVEGVNVDTPFWSESVVKAMLLVAYLRRADGIGGGLDAAGRALLYPMIHVSDNNAAQAIYSIVGESGLMRLAGQVGMTDFVPGVFFGHSQITASDQVRFFLEQDDLIPARYRSYARDLLAGIDPSQRWGVPAAVNGRWPVFFKGGWGRSIVNQVARIERPGHAFAVAVLTVGNPSMAYGEETIQGVASHLLDDGEVP
jgi:Beta-lactamase enzyme family